MGAWVPVYMYGFVSCIVSYTAQVTSGVLLGLV